MQHFKQRLGNEFNHIQIKTQSKYRRLFGKIIEITDPTLKNYQSRLQSLKGKYQGQRCFMMGNGPSLNRTPLEKLSGEYVWGFNRCYLLFDQIDWRPSFYVSVDTRVTPDNADEINDLFSLLPETSFFFPREFRMQRIINSAPNVYWFREVMLSDNVDDLPDSHFSLDPASFMRSVRTVTIAGLQLAVYMGFNPIYLIGCDTDYKEPDTVRFEDKEKQLLISTKDNDIDHFAPNYFGKGKKYHQPLPGQMLFSYKQVKEVCDLHGVDIFNATIGGKLEVFERVRFESLFE